MPRLTPSEFASKWHGNERTERAAAQEHFMDLCRLLEVPTPNEADPKGEWYAFEKGVEKVSGGDGYADVWKRGHFAWEYKGKRRDLQAAYQQLLQYREALENPPCLVVCDLERFQVHTNFTGTAKAVHEFTLADLVREPQEPLRVLRAVMTDPEALRPSRTRDQITREAAEEFATLATALRRRGHDPHRVAHFLNKILFSMFAEDAGLLPKGLIERLVAGTGRDPDAFGEGLRTLFARMSRSGGLFGVERIEWFNGGLFDGDEVLPLATEDIAVIGRASRLDWSEIEPAIFGTLFERGLDPDSRTSLGAHYTDRASIMRIVDPVVIAPLRREFEAVKAATPLYEVQSALGGKGSATARKALAKARKAVGAFLDRLAGVRVLDPACGSGNFLYLALQALKDLEQEVRLWGEVTLHHTFGRPRVGPEALLGIEINDYAAELARVTIWIGEIQWMISHGFAYRTNPILQPLDNIECRDAILDLSNPKLPVEAVWPDAEFIIGNPPFLGRKKLLQSLGADYRGAMEGVFGDRLPPGADLCCYWFEMARRQVVAGRTKRVGLLATQAIRGGTNRRVMDRIVRDCRIFSAVSDRPWVLDGAMVHVAIVCFDTGSEARVELDGREVPRINADLSSGLDLTVARALASNEGIAFQGVISSGDFDLTAEAAREMLRQLNPGGRPNSDVVRQLMTGRELLGRRERRWVIDFGVGRTEAEASLYEAPFERVKSVVRPGRELSRYAHPAKYPFWQMWNPRPEFRGAVAVLPRFVITARHSRHRVFDFLDSAVLPDDSLIAFARSDDYFLGILQSSVHERWARRKGTQVREAESGSRYTPGTCFETFAFPPLAGGIKGDGGGKAGAAFRARIAKAAERLSALRERWLTPTDATRKPAPSEEDLRARTLTTLYNERPTWLEHAHLEIDRAVLAAYGWPEEWADGLPPRRDAKGKVNPALGVQDPAVEQEVLARLLDLNLALSAGVESLPPPRKGK